MQYIKVNVVTGEQTIHVLSSEEVAEIRTHAAKVEAEEAMPNLRQRRDSILRESDISVMPDRWAAMSTETQTAWATYRQALRDLPANTTDPLNPTWPTRPGA